MAAKPKTLSCPHCGQPAHSAPSPNTGVAGEFFVMEGDGSDVWDPDQEMYHCSSGIGDHTFYTSFHPQEN